MASLYFPGLITNCFEVEKIYVPTASVDDYVAAWPDYAVIITGYDFE